MSSRIIDPLSKIRSQKIYLVNYQYPRIDQDFSASAA